MHARALHPSARNALLPLALLLSLCLGLPEPGAAAAPDADDPPPDFQRYGLGGKLSPPPRGAWWNNVAPAISGAPALSSPFWLPAFGTDVNVSNTSANELTIAAHPTDPLTFVAGANASGLTGHYTTTDGGYTWLRGTFTGIGDPAVAFDALGNAYFAHLSNYNCPDPIQVHKSTDGGVTWGAGVVALSDPDPANHFVDKEWLAVDTWPASPYYGRVYVAATSFYAPACDLANYVDNREVLAYSSDGGMTWSPSITVSDPAHNQNQFVNPVVAPDGRVYLGFQYQNCTYNCHGLPASNMLTRSTDGGVSWSLPITITGQPISYTGASVGGYQMLYASSTTTGFRHNDQAILGVSPLDPDVVYAMWTDGRWETSFVYQSVTGLHGDILFSRSTDGGATWLVPPLRVNDDALGNGKDQFFPWMTVGNDGRLHAAWMDRRDAASGFPYHVYYSQSTDGGLSWSANQRVTDNASTPSSFIGDYNGIAVNADNTLVLPIWTDMRSGQRGFSDRGVLPLANRIFLPLDLYHTP